MLYHQPSYIETNELTGGGIRVSCRIRGWIDNVCILVILTVLHNGWTEFDE